MYEKQTREEPTADEVDERAAYAGDLRGWVG